MNTITLKSNSDLLGSAASGLCLAHCLATPFLFAAHIGHVHGHHAHPEWWGALDVVFIAISFIAVYWSVRHSNRNWIKLSLWAGWILLAFVILNEKLTLIAIPEAAIYIPSVALVVLHLYNRRYCNCQREDCCVNG